MILQIEKFVDPSAIQALLPEWEALDEQVTPRTPFTSPLWIRAWWHHFRRRRFLTRDEFLLLTLRNKEGQLIAVAPMMITYKPAFGPVRMRVLQFIGADPSITEVRGMVCRLEYQSEAIRALVKYLRTLEHEWDLLLWRGIRDTGLTDEALLGGLHAFDALPGYVLDVPASWEKFLVGLSSNMRKTVRKSYEFLERDGHKFRFRSQNRPEDMRAALDCFFALHTARAAAHDMKTHPDRFGIEQHRAMLIDFARQMSDREKLQMLQLEIDGQVAATRVAFRLGNELYLYYSGYDLAWRKYSVMTTLMAETIKWAMKQGIMTINLSTGTDLSKLRWKPTEILYYNALIASSTPKGRLALLAHNARFTTKAKGK